ncbi:DUF805 domain-containing protein [Acinetobacter seifertii]|uniref:DUF805 domain-containing protein n=1 Tax=Acinetobacter seifertii TaxID=1530123 RepID=UPI000C1F91D6|nr:DUF805 domain-containing protein [Acinetobacter seifertii]PJF04194.1 DUF805 domain-containing protein [Acinetobacter seifertii]PJG68725.1 DUF805 domain-containing protein [Acinetobacter seifertii]
MNSPFENQPLQPDSPFKANGRFGRLSYAAWSFLLFLVVVFAVLIIAFTFGLTNEDLAGHSTAGMIVIGIAYIVCMYINFVFAIRRLHDCDNTGWLSLLMLIPVVNIIFLIYLFGASGTEGNNEYGPQRPTPSWERVLGWIYIILIPLALILTVVATIMAPTH